MSSQVYFYTYNLLKKVVSLELKKRGLSGDITPIPNLVIASIAGCINVLMTGPLWVANMRLTVQQKKKTESRDSAKPTAATVETPTESAPLLSSEPVKKEEAKAVEKVYYTGILHVLTTIAKKVNNCAYYSYFLCLELL